MKTFKQVFIKSEADLPEDGFYYAYLKSSNMICLMKMSQGYKPFWIEDVDWYLIEVPDNRDAIIEKQREMIEHLEDRLRWHKGKNYSDATIECLKSKLSALEAPPEDKSETGV